MEEVAHLGVTAISEVPVLPSPLATNDGRNEAEFILEGKSYHVRAGQMWRLPGGVPHKVIAGDRPMRAIDVFYPVREDMRGNSA